MILLQSSEKANNLSLINYRANRGSNSTSLKDKIGALAEIWGKEELLRIY